MLNAVYTIVGSNTPYVVSLSFLCNIYGNHIGGVYTVYSTSGSFDIWAYYSIFLYNRSIQWNIVWALKWSSCHLYALASSNIESLLSSCFEKRNNKRRMNIISCLATWWYPIVAPYFLHVSTEGSITITVMLEMLKCIATCHSRRVHPLTSQS